HYIALAGLPIEVDSAGTSNYHPNKAPDSRSQKYAKVKGYDLSALRARQIRREDFEQADLILAMDQTNLTDLQWKIDKISQQDQWETAQNAKLALMSEHDPQFLQQAVPDPYFGQASDFERVITQCESSAKAWVAYWQANPQVLQRQP
ncbi:MAG: low molecular weight phosphotyrosine protein phosphatase, partial [Moraxellaceae bacterium]